MTTTGPMICDTSGLIAAADVGDPDHQTAAEVLRGATGPFVVSPLVVAETDHLLRARLGDEAARLFARDVTLGAYDLASLSAGDLAACREVDQRYADLGLGLADSHLVVLARQFRTSEIMTLNERQFRTVRPLQGYAAFRLLPADM